jgi:hypothetical protein
MTTYCRYYLVAIGGYSLAVGHYRHREMRMEMEMKRKMWVVGRVVETKNHKFLPY